MNSRVEKLAPTSSKIFGGDKARNRRIEELKDTIKVTQEAWDCAVKEYERIKVFCFVFDSFLCLFASLSLLEKHRGIILIQHFSQLKAIELLSCNNIYVATASLVEHGMSEMHVSLEDLNIL